MPVSIENANIRLRLKVESELGKRREKVNRYNKAHGISDPDNRRWLRVFNNFHGSLPGGWRRYYPAQILERPYDQLQNKTPRQFFDDIDEIINGLSLIPNSRISSTVFEELQQKAANDPDRVTTLNNIDELAIPVYVGMRLKGYSHRSLVT